MYGIIKYFTSFCRRATYLRDSRMIESRGDYTQASEYNNFVVSEHSRLLIVANSHSFVTTTLTKQPFFLSITEFLLPFAPGPTIIFFPISIIR